MTFLFKLSQRVARIRTTLALVAAVAAVVGCESENLVTSTSHKPELATAAAGTVGAVSDLRVTAASDTSLTVAFTEVDDGTGLAASYDVRYAPSPVAWGSAQTVTRGSCAAPVAGSSIGSTTSCTVSGLSRSTKYDVQVVPFRGTLNVSAVFGALSNVATGSTLAAPASPVTTLIQETFEDGSFAARGWYDNSAMSTTTAQHVTGSTSALEMHFLPGATTPTWGGAARRQFPASESVYLSYWVKYSSNWVGSGHTYHPHEFLFLTNEDGVYSGLSFTHLTTYVEENYQNGGIPSLSMQDGLNIDQTRILQDLSSVTENRGAAGCNGNTDGYATSCYQSGGQYTNEKIWRASQPYFQPNPGAGYKGEWHFVEAYFQLNSIQNGKGINNGILRYWFDGQLVIDRTNVLLRTGAHPTMKFNQFIVAPYIGDGSPVDQTMWVDNLTVATGRIGTPAAPSVASVTVAPTAASVAIGGPLGFGATLKDASGSVLTGLGVAWTSSNTAVATVSGSGTATGLSAGSATITVTSGGISGSATLTVTGPVPVASVTVSPTPVNQLVGAAQQLAVTLKDASGNILTGRTVTWASSNGAVAKVSGSGLETGLSVGTATITASSGGVSSGSPITVNATKPGTVGDITVVGKADTSVTLSFSEVGDGAGLPASYDIRFAAGSLSWGSASDVTRGICAAPLAGTAIGAKRTCTVNGLAAATGYQFQVVAFRGTLNVNAVFGSLSSVASGTTTAATQPPPPPPGTWPNEPSGLSVLTDYGFGAALPVTPADVSIPGGSGWNVIYNGAGYGSTVSDPTAPFSPAAVLQLQYPVGFTGGSSPATLYYNLPGVSQVYAGLWWKPSNPWQGHSPSNVNKIAFMIPGNSGDIYIAMYGPPGGPYELRVLPEFPGLPINWYVPNVKNVSVVLGQWHRIEWFMDKSAGILRWWLDGQLIGDYSGVPYPSAAFSEFKISSTWGGIGDTKQETDYYWFDHARVSGR